jgi:hypothetical protein
MKVYIDSQYEEITLAIIQVLGLFVDKNDILSTPRQVRGSILKKIEIGELSNSLIIQTISKSRFVEYSRDSFQYSGERIDNCEHPLYYRYSFNDFRKLEIYNKQGYAKYKLLCHPILYITDFKVGDSNDQDYSFLDSSIWHRSLYLYDPSFVLKLCQRINDFQRWHQESLYSRLVALEALDYHIRMFKEQRLPFINENDEKGHAGNVKLGFWHSETECDQQTPVKRPLPRRFLLIDDYADIPLRKVDDIKGTRDTDQQKATKVTNENIKEFSKTDYIWKALKDLYDIKDRLTDNDFELFFVKSIEDARHAIKDKFYDMILLDYLLEDGEKGSDFVKEIIVDRDEFSRFRGPKDKFWIFPVSAFSTAMTAEISSGKLQAFEKLYILHSGADPVSTPLLFKYKLRKFLNMQISEVEFKAEKFLREKFSETAIGNNLRTPGKHETSNRYDSIRTVAKNCYPEITRRLGETNQLITDKAKDSMFAASLLSIIGDSNEFLLLEHLHHLIYLLAYSPSIQWAQMWEELNTISQLPISDSCSDSVMPECLLGIRNYIVKISEKV